MTKEITKAYILQELQDKFAMRDLEPERFTFSEQVIPIYDIKPHLLKYVATYAEKSVTSTGSKVFFTVSGTEEWVFDRYDIIFMGAGAYTVAGALIQRKGGSSVYLDLTAAQSASYHVQLPMPVIMQAGDTFEVNIDGYTSTQNLRVYLDCTKEVIR